MAAVLRYCGSGGRSDRYDLFSNVPVLVQNTIEARLDAATNTAPTAQSQTLGTNEDTALGLMLTATDPNVNNVLTYTVNSEPFNGQLSGTGANVTYIPNPDLHRQDSFTFEAWDQPR